MARHLFGKIPAFEHAGFRLYEAGAIIRYVDEVFHGPRLQPDDVRGRARMNQIISILDTMRIEPWCGISTWRALLGPRAMEQATSSA
jgi:glutathione S-transferase